MKTIMLAATALLALASPAAAATLMDGKTVTLTYLFPNTSTIYLGPVDYTVGTSGPVSFAPATAAVGDKTLTLTANCGEGCSWANAMFNGIRLSDRYGVVNGFYRVGIDASSSYAGFDMSRISFDANSISVNWQGLNANGTVVLNINAPVPEPATWAMLITGFGLVGSALRRRKPVAA